MDELGGDAVHDLKALLNLEATIAQFEQDACSAKSDPIEIAPLVAACKRLGFFGEHHHKGPQWLMVYLLRRWGLTSDALNEFEAQLAEWNPGVPMPVSTHAPSD